MYRRCCTCHERKISFGVIVAFMIYIRLFTQPLSQIAQAMQSMQSAAAAAERVFEFVEAEEMEMKMIRPERLKMLKAMWTLNM